MFSPFLLSWPPLLPDARRPSGFKRCLGAAVALVLALSACSPTFNWREVRPAGTPLLALMPCKPELATRTVPLGGDAPTELHMHSCETAGITFALAWSDVGEASRSAQAMAVLRQASLAAIRVDPAQVDAAVLQWPARVPGAQNARGLQAQGTQHQQRAVQMRAVHFSRGSQVFQAAVYGSALPDEVSATFFDGLRLP